ncbi:MULTISPECIES: Htur_1727 family rSAM-partnered candidate RiPP [Natrinema]|uniref:Phenylacetic acid degradation B n=1 Tax=Natrinema gari JCM 14663 TaxID=1230459 RepID=L9YP75_9EURY|nr:MULTISPECIES: Htur_1727 family rSAM-partnered candidate RiPP [Natrinema]AFO58596.1 phenylacetic acid degradation B [Natrinema sp. J7-2]ELY75476.1 phenylacetic acid degradation B [Natrinema gari JCM 14663]
MVEKARRSAVESDERGNPTRQWEVFIRNEEGAPMRHVGSVAAASGTEAHEHASRLFGWYAADIWLCPADDVERYSTRGLAETAEERPDEGAGDGDDSDGKGEEPRVYEETAGASEVNSP